MTGSDETPLPQAEPASTPGIRPDNLGKSRRWAQAWDARKALLVALGF